MDVQMVEAMAWMVERRLKLGLRQEDAAALARVTREAWNAWECGRRVPRRKRLLVVAEALQLDVAIVAAKCNAARAILHTRRFWADVAEAKKAQAEAAGGEGGEPGS